MLRMMKPESFNLKPKKYNLNINKLRKIFTVN